MKKIKIGISKLWRGVMIDVSPSPSTGERWGEGE